MEGLPTTPESPSLKIPVEEPFPRTSTERAMVDIFAAKSFVAHKIHCNSRLRIGRRSLVDWLEPNAFKVAQWQKEFLHDLSNCKPWVIKGDSSKSRLVKELSWEGKMFGSFTQAEVEVVKVWIDELGQPAQATKFDATPYLHFTERHGLGSLAGQKDTLVDYPVLSTTLPAPAFATPYSESATLTTKYRRSFDSSKLENRNFLPLWFTSSTLLESLPSVPVRAADAFGSAIVRVLRAQTGFDIEGLGVAGMDEVRRTEDGQAIGIIELGFEMCKRMGLGTPKNMRDAVSLGNAESIAFAEWMVWTGMRWLAHRDLLIGMAWAFMEVHEMIATSIGDQPILSEEGLCILKDIADRERSGLEVCKMEIEADEARNTQFRRGHMIAWRAIEACAAP
jgi:hypothetical protein